MMMERQPVFGFVFLSLKTQLMLAIYRMFYLFIFDDERRWNVLFKKKINFFHLAIAQTFCTWWETMTQPVKNIWL